MNGYMTYDRLMATYDLPKYGLCGQNCKNYKKIRRLIANGELESITHDNHLYISIDSIEKHIKKIDAIRKDCLNVYEFLEDFAGIERLKCKNYFKNLKIFAEKTCLEIIELDTPDNKYFINKESYLKFKNDYISVLEAFNQLKNYKFITGFVRVLAKEGIKTVIFQSKYAYIFFKREQLKYFGKEVNSIKVDDAIKELEIKATTFYKFFRDNNIETFFIGKFSYIQNKEFEHLKTLQEHELLLTHFNVHRLTV